MRQVLGAGALGRPRGMGWGGRWERGPGWGTHVNPWLIHVNVWQKPLQYWKVISFQLIKINGKKNLPFQLFLNVQFSDIKHIYTIVQSLELFSSCETETLYPLKAIVPIPRSPRSLVISVLLPMSVNLTIPGTSYK